MAAEDAAVAIDDLALAVLPAEDVGEVAAVEILALLPVVDREAGLAGDRPDPRLRHLPEREEGRGQLGLA